MSLFKKKEQPKRRNLLEELKKANAKPKDALIIEVLEGCINISGRSYTENDRAEWLGFLQELKTELIPNLKKLTINITIDMFNTSLGQYPTIMMKTLADNLHKCKAIINWNYGDDSAIYGHGLILKQNYPNVEFNLIGVDNISDEL